MKKIGKQDVVKEDILEKPFKAILRAEGDHDKWFVRGNNKSWMEITLINPRNIRAYAMKSANDALPRHPTSWKLLMQSTADDEPRLVHQMQKSDRFEFNEFWETKIFILGGNESNVFKIRLEVTGNGGVGDLQLGQIIFYE